MNTLFSLVHISGHDAQGLLISLLQMKMMHFVWTEEETQYLISNKREKYITTIINSDQM